MGFLKKILNRKSSVNTSSSTDDIPKIEIGMKMDMVKKLLGPCKRITTMDDVFGAFRGVIASQAAKAELSGNDLWEYEYPNGMYKIFFENGKVTEARFDRK